MVSTETSASSAIRETVVPTYPSERNSRRAEWRILVRLSSARRRRRLTSYLRLGLTAGRFRSIVLYPLQATVSQSAPRRSNMEPSAIESGVPFVERLRGAVQRHDLDALT